MKEDFLHYLWKQRRFDLKNLQTTDHQALEILHPGEYNTHAGPDFFNARIRIGNTLWAGNIEMHLRASEWLLHSHHTDPAYDNVVLHVVFEEDQALLRNNGEPLPCLVLRHRIPPRLLESYRRLEQERNWIPCQNSLKSVPEIVWNNWLDRMLVERLEHSTTAFRGLLAGTNRHWEEAFYQRMAWNFGLKVNASPFLQMARSLPLTLVGRHRNSPFQLEALFFGQAGLLRPDFQEEYPRALHKEFQFLQHKYGFSPMPGASWKFLRLRPANFPSLRIAQFAALMHQKIHLFAEMMEAPDVASIEQLFAVTPGEYWNNHYVFEKESKPRPKIPGKDLAHSAIVNSIAPVLFLYGKEHARIDWQQKAMDWLEALPPESNTVVSGWSELGIKVTNAHRSQALLQLKNCYCNARRCMECAVGNAVLRE